MFVLGMVVGVVTVVILAEVLVAGGVGNWIDYYFRKDRE